MLRMITNRSPSPKLKPLPRAAQTNRSPSPAPLRGFPLPLWRGVNGIANHGLITTLLQLWINCSIANYSRTVASVPRPPAIEMGYLREDGARRPPSYFNLHP